MAAQAEWRGGRPATFPGARVGAGVLPVASAGHLIALKALAGHHQDLTDLGYLSAAATAADLDEAAAAAALIEERGFNRGQSLSQDLAAIISQAQKR